MTNSKKIFGGFAVGIALFFFWPAVIGGWQEIGALRDAAAQREMLLEQRQAILNDVQSSYAQYQQLLNEQDGDRFAALVPVRKDSAEILSALQAIASEVGVALGEVRMSEDQSSANTTFMTLSLVVELSGSYQGMHQFVARLEQYVRLLNVQSIEVVTDTQNPGTVRFSIFADAYFIR